MTKATPPKTKKRIRNPEKTREKILKATLDLVAEKGVEALSMKEAAIKADVSRSVAYLHFEDRDHLLREAKSWISAQLREGVEMFDDHASLYERILYTTKVVMKNPEASKVMVVDALGGGDLGLQDPLYKLVFNRLKKQQAEGKLDADIDVEILTYIHLGSIASTLLLLAQHKRGSVDKLAERFADQWSKILGATMTVPVK